MIYSFANFSGRTKMFDRKRKCLTGNITFPLFGTNDFLQKLTYINEIEGFALATGK
jgi:hypothetical protein